VLSVVAAVWFDVCGDVASRDRAVLSQHAALAGERSRANRTSHDEDAMTRFDFVKAFYESSHTHGSIVGDIDAVLGSRPRELKVTAIPFTTARTPPTDFPTLVGKSRSVTLVSTTQGLHLFELKYVYKEGLRKRTDSGRFFVYVHPSYPHVFAALTLEPSTFVRRGLLPFLRNQFPHVVVGFVPHARLKRLLGEFRANYEFTDLIITRATQRLRLPEEGIHRRVMPVMTWPDMALDEAIDWLVEHNGWFQAVQFDAKRDGHTAARISITRDGVVRCDYLFEQVFRAFVLPVCKLHHENFNLFSRRSRRDNPDLAARPLTIKFDEERFDDLQENQIFIQAMRSLQTASVSVLHGNPYIHLGVIDYMDGSTFDLWVVDSRELIIVPQLYVSVGAIKRLVNHIYDTYAEGEVSDFPTNTA
jgi:hypothetical protein